MDDRKQQHWFVGALLILVLSLEGTAEVAEKVPFKTSCYTFHTDKKNWENSTSDCTARNDNLVVMETEVEWEFINEQIRKITVVNDNKWYIGLTGKTTEEWKNFQLRPNQTISKRKGWTWVNGKPLTIDKWQPGQPSGDTTYGNDACVVMAKNYPEGTQGLFNDMNCRYEQRYICESSSAECSQRSLTTTKRTTPTHKAWATNAKTTTSTTTTKEPQQTSTKTTIQDTPPSTSKPQTASSGSTSRSTITTNPTFQGTLRTSSSEKPASPNTVKPTSSATSSTRKQSEEKQSAKKGFPLILIVIVLCALLIVCMCLVLAACFWRRRKKEESRHSSKKSKKSNKGTPTRGEAPTAATNINEIVNDSSFVAFTMVHNNLTHTKTPTEDPDNDSVRTDNNTSNLGVTMETPTEDPNYDAVRTDNNMSNLGVTMETPLATNIDETQSKQEVVYASVDKSKKRNSKKKNCCSRANSKKALTKEQVNVEDETKGSYSSPSNGCDDEAVYAKVEKTQQQPQITYADLAEFNNTGSSPSVKPAPYQPVEYAVIMIGKKTSN